MSTPTSPNTPDPSAESETRAASDSEALDVSQNDPTRELELPAPEAGSEPTEAIAEPTEPATVWSEPAATSVAGSVATAEAPAEAPATATGTVPQAPTGPHLPAILLGVTCLIVAIIAIAEELGRLTIDWGNVGPLGIVAAGAVLVILGLVGLMASRKKS